VKRFAIQMRLYELDRGGGIQGLVWLESKPCDTEQLAAEIHTQVEHLREYLAEKYLIDLDKAPA
jgi:hypothetical protein